MKYVLILAFCLATLFFIDTASASTYGVVTGSTVNVRSYAQISYNLVSQVNRGQKVQILDVDGDFFRVHVGDYSYVYISRDWVNISSTRGTVNYHGLFIYDLPCHEDGHPIGSLHSGMSVTVVSRFDDWLGIIHEDGYVFVEATHIAIPHFVELQPSTINDNTAGSLGLADDIVNFAMRYLGTRYVFGGKTPSGFDCSGLMVYVMRNFDISLYRRSADMARNGVHVNRGDIQRADLLFFATMGGNRISHVGLYIGGGQMIHSANVSTGVRISNIHSDYFRTRFVTARRVI